MKILFYIAISVAGLSVQTAAWACETEFAASGTISAPPGSPSGSVTYDRISINYDSQTINFRQASTGNWFTPPSDPGAFEYFAKSLTPKGVDANC